MLRIAFAALVIVSVAYGQAPVQGQLTVDGMATKLTQAYAYNTKGFFDEKKDDTVVLLTDRPVSESQLRDGFSLRRLAGDGKLIYIQETINTEGQIINFSIGHSGFKIPVSGGSTEHVFDGAVEGRTIAGKVSTKGVQDTFGGTKYEYSATFKAPILPKK